MKRLLGVLFALMSSQGCSDRVELLSTENNGHAGVGGTSGADGSAGHGAGGGGGRAWQSCEEALHAGNDGEACSFADSCLARDRCSYLQLACRGGLLVFASQRDPGCTTSCASDGECTFGAEWCEADQCVVCNDPGPAECEHGWSRSVFPRNGCSVVACAPPSECYTSEDCQPGLHCYAGQTCGPDCRAGDSSCCEGNFCARPGCESQTVRLSCEQIGCPLGARCAGGEWTPPSCECDGFGMWNCQSDQNFYVCE